MPYNSGSRLLILLSFLIRFFLVSPNGDWIKHTMAPNFILCWNFTEGVVFLFYPLFGWISGKYSAHYNMIKAAFILTTLSSFLMLLTAIERILYAGNELIENIAYKVRIAISVLVLALGLSGLGIYEANVIQFGMRQLFEAPAEKLSAFIHWYYWALNLAPLLAYYVTIPIMVYYENCKIEFNGTFENHENVRMFGWGILPSSLVQAIAGISGLVVICFCRGHFESDFQKINPFKTVVEVIKYASKQKFPANRSAFTYWENTIPPRIDNGKRKYGGPFSNEEVEDTKTFFRLILVILSLFGYYFSTDEYYLEEFLIKKLGCPSRLNLMLLVINPGHQTILLVLIGIPIYQLIVVKYFAQYLPKLLTRIWIGMLLCLIREFMMPFFSYSVEEKNKQAISCAINKTKLFMGDDVSTLSMCMFSTTKFVRSNGDCFMMCAGVINDSHLFYFSVIPQVLQGLSLILVFMTVLEFICAQAPHTMKGLLIGIWYAMHAMKYIAIDTINMLVVNSSNSAQWTVYIGAKGMCIFISLVLYSLVYKQYQYRERNEVVNEQAIIEEQYERELLNNSNCSSSDDSQ